MGHKTGAHTDEIPMEKGVYRRGNKFYFRKRIPKDLIGHPEFVKNGKNETERKGALGTSDPKEANRLALNRKAELENLFLSIRQQMAADKETKSPSVSQPVIPINRSRKVTKHDLDSIWVNEFESLEKEAVVERKVLGEYKVDSDDAEELAIAIEAKQDAVSTLYHQFSEVNPQGCNVPTAIDWEQVTNDRLELNGIKPSELSSLDLKYLAARLQEANAEVLLRSIDVAEGRHIKVHDSLLEKAVEDFHASTRTQGGEGSLNTKDKGWTIRELGKRFLEVKKRSHAKTVEDGEYVTTLRIFNDFFGADIYASSITEDQCYELVDFLRVVPANIDKNYRKYQNLSLVKLSKKVQSMPKEKQHFLSPASQHKHFNRIVFMLADPSDKTGLRKVKECPIRNQMFRDLLPRIPKKEKVLLTDQDLATIFSHDLYQKYFDMQGREGEFHCGRYWSVLLCMHHGMRLNEACQLLQDDVREHSGIYYLDIGLESEDGEVTKSLKTGASRRFIPLHSKLIELGFLEFCTAQKKLTSSPFLFPELVPSKGHEHSKSVGRHFKSLLRKCIDPSSMPNKGDKMTHTLRHRVTNMLRSSNVDSETRYFLMGWSGGEKVNAGADYGGKLEDLPYLQEVLESHVKFPNFNYGVLRVWESE